MFCGRYCITFDAYKRSKIGLCLGPRSVFIGNVFINPAYRRQGLYSCMLRAIANEQHASRGIAEVLVNVKGSNFTSVAAHRRLGFRTVCTLYHAMTRSHNVLVAIPAIGRFRISTGNDGKEIPCERLCRQGPGRDPSL